MVYFFLVLFLHAKIFKRSIMYHTPIQNIANCKNMTKSVRIKCE